jgi:hypothetical protein
LIFASKNQKEGARTRLQTCTSISASLTHTETRFLFFQLFDNQIFIQKKSSRQRRANCGKSLQTFTSAPLYFQLGTASLRPQHSFLGLKNCAFWGANFHLVFTMPYLSKKYDPKWELPSNFFTSFLKKLTPKLGELFFFFKFALLIVQL